jgi:hypothetical protein
MSVSMEVPDGMIRAPNGLFEPRCECDYEKINDSVKRMSRGADLHGALRESGLFSFSAARYAEAAVLGCERAFEL